MDSATRTRTRENAVTVNRGATRTKTGGVHTASRKSLLRQARTENPAYADAACLEIFYGTSESTKTTLYFDPTREAIYGL